MPWMGYHPFQISYGYMVKVLQAWDIINTLGSCSSKPQSTQAVGVDLAGYAKPPQAILMIWYVVK